MDNTLAQAQQPHVMSFVSDHFAQVACTVSDAPPQLGSCLFHSGLTWRLHDTTDGYALCMYRGEAEEVYQTLHLTRDFLRGEVHVPLGITPGAVSLYSLDSGLFQLWASFLLTRSRGVVVHALGVKRQGMAHVFLGKSGAGKSTLARLITQAGAGDILSDDRVVVRRDGDEFRVYGTPWNGESQHHLADHAPLKAIYFLEQTPSCILMPISTAVSATQVFAASSVAGWPIMNAMQSVLDLTAAMAKSATGYRFGFTPDNRAMKALGWS